MAFLSRLSVLIYFSGGASPPLAAVGEANLWVVYYVLEKQQFALNSCCILS